MKETDNLGEVAVDGNIILKSTIGSKNMDRIRKFSRCGFL